MLRICFFLLLFISIQSTAQITGAWEGAGFERDSSGEYPVMSRLYIKNESGTLKASIYTVRNGRIMGNGELGMEISTTLFDFKKKGSGYIYERPELVISKKGDGPPPATGAQTLILELLPGDSTLSFHFTIAGTSVTQAYLLKDTDGNKMQQLLNRRLKAEVDSLSNTDIGGQEKIKFEEDRAKRLQTIAFDNGKSLQLRYFPKDSIALAWVTDLNPIPLKMSAEEFSLVQKNGLRISSAWVIGHWDLPNVEQLMGLWLESASISYGAQEIKYPTEKYYETLMGQMKQYMPGMVGGERLLSVQPTATATPRDLTDLVFNEHVNYYTDHRLSLEDKQRICSLLKLKASPTGAVHPEDDRNFAYSLQLMIRVVDFNRDGYPEVFLTYYNIQYTSQTGLETIFSKKPGGQYREILAANGSSEALASESNGFPDLLIGGPGFTFPVYRFNGTTYVYHRSFKDKDYNKERTVRLEDYHKREKKK